MTGTPVTEEHVAKELGFADVFELRRWKTEMGSKVGELENKLNQSVLDARNFKWHVERMFALLNGIEAELIGDSKHEKMCRLIRFVTNREPDWNNELRDWLRSNGGAT